MTTDPILDWLTKNDVPVTRENYIELNWMGAPPDPWTAEDEAQLPPELQEGEKEPTRDDTGIWIESKHPRRGKGPQGGQFTKGAGGGGAAGPEPTVHVHVHRPPQRLSTEPPPLSDEERVAKRAQWFKEQHELRQPQIKAFNATVEGAAKKLAESGYHWLDDPPEDMIRDLRMSFTPPRDPKRMETAAAAYDDAVKAVKGAGMDALAKELTENVPVIMASQHNRYQAGKLDSGFIMATIRGASTDPAKQFVHINANSIPSIDVEPDPESSPRLMFDIQAMKKAGVAPDEIAKFEMKGATIHEFGHALDNWSGGRMTRTMGQAMMKALGLKAKDLKPTTGMFAMPGRGTIRIEDYLKHNISGYASTLPGEATAEAFYVMTTKGLDALPPELREWGAKWKATAAKGVPKQQQYQFLAGT